MNSHVHAFHYINYMKDNDILALYQVEGKWHASRYISSSFFADKLDKINHVGVISRSIKRCEQVHVLFYLPLAGDLISGIGLQIRHLNIENCAAIR